MRSWVLPFLLGGAVCVASCGAMEERNRLVDPATWVASPGAERRRSLSDAIDHCYVTYMKGREVTYARQIFLEYRRCMTNNGYQETQVVPNER